MEEKEQQHRFVWRGKQGHVGRREAPLPLVSYTFCFYTCIHTHTQCIGTWLHSKRTGGGGAMWRREEKGEPPHHHHHHNSIITQPDPDAHTAASLSSFFHFASRHHQPQHTPTCHACHAQTSPPNYAAFPWCPPRVCACLLPLTDTQTSTTT